MQLSYKKGRIDKFFEKLPAFITWFIILFPVIGSFFVPELVAVFILVFNVFFLYRSLAFSIQFILGSLRLRAASQIDWQAKLEGLNNIDKEIGELEKAKISVRAQKFDPTLQSLSNKYRVYRGVYRLPFFLQKILFNWEKLKTLYFIGSEIEKLHDLEKVDMPDAKDINHIIIIPHAKEPLKVLEDTLKRLSEQTFDTKKIHIVLGAEGRDPEGFEKSKILQKNFAEKFGHIWISVHELKDYEIVGKSSNMAAAGRVAKEKIKELGWNMKMTTVTSCDADSQLPEEYFSLLTYEYLTHKDRHFKFYTGAILLYANIWRVDFFARVRNSLSSMFNVGKLVRPDKFVPFSTYSTSFWLIDKAGYWTPWVTPEDYHIFFKSSFTFPSKVSTIPMYCKILVDAAEGDGAYDTFKNNYLQSRRWQWGVSDDGWVLKNLVFRFGRMNWVVYYRGLHVIMDHILAPSSSFLLVLGANLPPLLNKSFAGTVFGARLPQISALIIRFTLASFVLAIIFDTLLKPKRDGVSLLRRILTPLEWVVNPIVGLTLTSIPGLEAHTRLLFGKHLEYYITKKKAE